MSISNLDTMREHLKAHGSAVGQDADGRRIFFVMSRVLDMRETGILIAYEGEGAIFVPLDDRPLNVFRLLSAGFSANIAPTLADTVNGLLGLDGGSKSDINGPVIPQIPFKPT